MNNPKETGRLAYLDFVRGLSMVLVIFGHQLIHSESVWGTPAVINDVMANFRLPLFFFISGYFVYKPEGIWTFKYFGNTFLRKFQAQVIGTLFFSALFFLIHGYDFSVAQFMGEADRYWFTITLFRLFCFYGFFSLLFAKWNSRFLFPSLIVLLIVSLCICYQHSTPNRSGYFLGFRALYYYQFYLTGIFAKKIGMDIFGQLLFSTIGIIFTGLGFVLCCVLIYVPSFSLIFLTDSLFSFVIKEELIKYLGLFFIFGVFYKYRNCFEKENKFNEIGLLIGRRTLDLYFIHYFFLIDFAWLRKYLITRNDEIISQVLLGGIAVVVNVAICLLVSSAIRRSKFLATWLFGARPKSVFNP